jgi:hypothetical protein
VGEAVSEKAGEFEAIYQLVRPGTDRDVAIKDCSRLLRDRAAELAKTL